MKASERLGAVASLGQLSERRQLINQAAGAVSISSSTVELVDLSHNPINSHLALEEQEGNRGVAAGEGATDRAHGGDQGGVPQRPPRSRRAADQPAKTVYKRRNEIERTLSALKTSGAVATTFDKRAYVFHGTVNVASIRLWLRT